MRLQGVLFLNMNKTEEAKKAAARLKTYLDSIEIPKYQRFYHHLEGMIAQHENRNAEAAEHFSKAISLLSFQYEAFNDHAFHFYSQAMTYYHMNDWEKAQNQFEEVIELNAGRLQWGDIYAMSFYWLGKIHQKKNQTQEAIDDYERFLNLWKDADPGIHEVEDAKIQLDTIRS
jgi:tetratricopeptide (TPR) repeat protein